MVNSKAGEKRKGLACIKINRRIINLERDDLRKKIRRGRYQEPATQVNSKPLS